MLHPPLPRYRLQSRWSQERGKTVVIAVRAVRGLHPNEVDEFEMLSGGATLYDLDSLCPMPGQRLFTVAEYLGPRRRNESRYGSWVLVLKEYTEADPPFREWCRRHCHHETKSGFRIKPDTWEARRNDALGVPFLPEFDDPRAEVRELAASERSCRALAAWHAAETQARNAALAAASARGLTRRQAAELLNLSVGRVQQLLERRGT